MKKWLFIVAVIIISLIGYNYLYQDHRDIASETSVYKLTSKEIINEFALNPSASEAKYLNQTIEVSGIITEVNQKNIIIDQKIFCLLSKNTQTTLKTNTIKIKGRFIGFDDLLEQIKLDQCIVIN